RRAGPDPPAANTRRGMLLASNAAHRVPLSRAVLGASPVTTIEHLRAPRNGVAHLVQEDQVHRDVYISDDIFRLEQERLFSRAWLFLGHASQVPEPGDYVTAELAGQPLILVRRADRTLQVLANRCAHK